MDTAFAALRATAMIFVVVAISFGTYLHQLARITASTAAVAAATAAAQTLDRAAWDCTETHTGWAGAVEAAARAAAARTGARSAATATGIAAAAETPSSSSSALTSSDSSNTVSCLMWLTTSCWLIVDMVGIYSLCLESKVGKLRKTVGTSARLR